MSSHPTGTATHLVVMGVSGSGKTTLAKKLSERLGLPYAEADEFHPQANIDKMSRGVALTDEDRWPWLREMRDWMSAKAHDDDARGSVVTCSALKHSYRDLLREADGVVLFLHVDCDPEVLTERITARSDHFMPPSLLPSQLKTLEPLAADEAGARILNDGTIEDLVDRALAVIDDHTQNNHRASAQSA
ncbi:gluconokinase [Zhihengliuella sp.]|uniref:gluconokinase n=1 Tax=Zhihengliuella sp. TaxID=1954483 RepID=UPI0028128D31|nr:gluconokinase [Zhihengliuella sp.]